MHLDGGGTVESNERGRGRHFADQGGEGGNERQRESARPQQGENCAAEGQLEVGRSVTDGEMTERITIAVKLINTQSKHVQREIFCLKHFDNCREGHVKSLLTAEHERLENDTLNTEAPSSAVLVPSDTRLSQPPSPRLFFVKELKAHVALGLELLGPDLFDFTGKCRLFEEELCLVGIELLRTLSALHMRGLVHRSVKPENFCWNTEGLEKCRNRTSAGCLTGVEKDSDKSSPYYFPEFLFKMVDFGRGTIDASDPARTSLYERPYGGWWHSLNGFLGKPMGQKDDLNGCCSHHRLSLR
ncbi:unnamed protein product [Trypanosoma congolense IL3000]|uniref:WGS project CAEQ00000000 data, annotated contig 568 n=1 Tax=Trypanosoma congolense (strain IL3000) TaxID=1068625 RepID=F9WGX6_TRYCI|nr:unnamed protein product [Trypanosoma congolense IL3000]